MTDTTTTGSGLLRAAAKLMRERAESATAGPWENNDLAGPTVMAAYGSPADGASIAGANHWDDAEYIASWHPVVALGVAEWLESLARRSRLLTLAPVPNSKEWQHGLTVASAYLGDPR